MTIVDDDKQDVIIETPVDEIANPVTSIYIPIKNTCSSGNMIDTTCDFAWDKAKDNIGKNGNVSHLIVKIDIKNEGLIGNSEITKGNQVTGVVLTGYITNHGILKDFNFVGYSISGANEDGEIVGTLSGKICNNSKIGGILKNHIIGDKEQPALLESLLIRPKSVISNVIIGDNVKFEKDITLDGNISFSSHASYMKYHNITQLPALGDAITLDSETSETTISFAKLTGGASENGGVFKRKTKIKRKSQVTIKSNLLVDMKHIGKQADILVVAVHTVNDKDTFYMLNPENKPIIWDGKFSNLLAFQKQVSLAPVEQLDIWNEVLDIAGSVTVYIGYRLTDGRIVYSPTDLLEMNFTK